MKYTIRGVSEPGRLVGLFRTLPTDLLVVAAAVLAVDGLAYMGGLWDPLRVLLGIPVLFFLPGYVLCSVLFPSATTAGAENRLTSPVFGSAEDGGLSFTDRLALSFGTSVALVPLFGIAIALLGLPYTPGVVLGTITVFVLAGAVLGSVRRLQVPPEDRFRVPVREWGRDLHGFLLGADGRPETVVNVLLVASIVVAASGFAFAIAAPPSGPEFSEYSLLTRSGDGGYVAAGYPTNFTRGEGRQLVVGIENHRDEATRYTVVVEVQRVRGDGESATIIERSELDRLNATVEAGDSWYGSHAVTPDIAGEDLRLVYYFYPDGAPARADAATADDHLHLWIDVSLPPEA